MTRELSRLLRIDRIGASGFTMTLVADGTELRAVAERMLIPAVLSLECEFKLHPGVNETFAADGMMKARVVQTCVVTLEDFEADLEERFSVRFVPAGTESEDIDVYSEDEIPYEGDTIDLGEAAVEQLGLSLDPYPRQPGAALPPEVEDEAFSAFAALRRLQS